MFVTVTLAVGGDGTSTDALFADGTLPLFHYHRRMCTYRNGTYFLGTPHSRYDSTGFQVKSTIFVQKIERDEEVSHDNGLKYRCWLRATCASSIDGRNGWHDLTSTK